MRGLALVPLALVVACSSGGAEPERIARTTAPVINGVVDVPPKYDATVSLQAILSGGYGAGCTGTLISPHVVITARHCVSSYNESTRTFGSDYTNMMVWYGPEPRGEADNKVARIVHNGASRIEDNDFAILVLAKAATKIPFAPIRLTKPPKHNETVAVAGYGLTTEDTGSSGGFEMHKRYRRENLKILGVGPMPSYGIGAKEIVLGESICKGDSGGPVYAQATSALLAVTSRGGNGKYPTASQPWASCVGPSTYNLFTRVDSYRELIEKTLAEVGEKAWEEGTPKPEPPKEPVPDPGQLGAGCTAPDDCEAKICVEWQGGKVCSQTCSESSPCPTGFDCIGGYCVKPAPPTEPPPEEPPPSNPAADEPVKKAGTCAAAPNGSAPSVAALSLLVAALLVARRRVGKLS